MAALASISCHSKDSGRKRSYPNFSVNICSFFNFLFWNWKVTYTGKRLIFWTKIKSTNFPFTRQTVSLKQHVLISSPRKKKWVEYLQECVTPCFAYLFAMLLTGRIWPDDFRLSLTHCRRIQKAVWDWGLARSQGWTVTGFHRDENDSMSLQGKMAKGWWWSIGACAILHPEYQALE